MKVAIYPGSFNPFHEGHLDVLDKAEKVFDKVIILIGSNPNKVNGGSMLQVIKFTQRPLGLSISHWDGLLKDYIERYNQRHKHPIQAIIKGIRNIQDFEYEKTMQYTNEDLGITIPTYYVIAKRDLAHISSSTIRGLEKFKEKK